MGQFGIGQPVRRKEDVRLLVGAGKFTDDIQIEGQLWAAFVRSPHANAKINGFDTSSALAMPGVVAVYTGKDCEAAGLKNVMTDARFEDRSGRPMSLPERWVMPPDHTRFVGECLAMVVADSAANAREAAEAVEIDFEPLPAIASTARALDKDAPKVWPQYDSNLIVHWEHGEKAVSRQSWPVRRIASASTSSTTVSQSARWSPAS